MSYWKSIFLTVASAAVLFGSGCVPTGNVPANNASVNTSNQSANVGAKPDREPERDLSSVAFTLPLLDAMLNDAKFLSEARTGVQLTDEEIDKLKTRSRNAVLDLSNDPALDDERSTRAALEKATEMVHDILGKERGDRLITLVRTKWSGEVLPTTARSNEIPSDTRVVVNIPAYRMDIFNNGELIKSYKIGIGYPEFPLPTGLRQAKSIIFNPTWTPPDEPWVKGKVAPGKTVEAGSKLNPLGPIKIPIGLPSLIHGGKSPSRLGTFASHGCVGLTDALIQDFALELSKLSGKPLTLDDIRGYEKKKTETQEVDLEKEVPVELRYETIVIEDGVLKIFRDVYEHGTNTEENLKRVLSDAGVTFDSLDESNKEKLLEAIEDMAVDAKGKPVEIGPTNSNQANTKINSNSSGKVTRNVKGRKEVSIAMPELKGKGYPKPVGMKN